MGRFGPFVQIGTKDDEEKPRFAGLRPGQKMDSIALPEAMELFKLPRTLGTTAEGQPIVTNIGRFGPYIKYGDKYVSLKDDDPYTVTLERSLECIRAKLEADANRLIRQFEDDIQVLNGRYGPYISDGQKNARVPKDREPRSLTLEECRQLLAAAAARPMRGRFGRRAPGKGAPGKGALGKGKAAAVPRAANGHDGNGTEPLAIGSAGPSAADAAPLPKRRPGAKSAAGKRRAADKVPVVHHLVTRKAGAHTHGRGAGAGAPAAAAAAKRGSAKTKTASRASARAPSGKKTAGA
jgi:DNA topoisomerase-1